MAAYHATVPKPYMMVPRKAASRRSVTRVSIRQHSPTLMPPSTATTMAPLVARPQTATNGSISTAGRGGNGMQRVTRLPGQAQPAASAPVTQVQHVLVVVVACGAVRRPDTGC